MKKAAALLCVSAMAMAMALGYFAVSNARVYIIVADSPLVVRRIVNAADTPDNTITTLRQGQQAVVVECANYKSDIALRVRTNGGETGYVSDGKFMLVDEARPFKHLLSDPDRLSWSCMSMFDSHKVARQ